MPLTIDIPQLIEARLTAKAKAAGVDLTAYARRVLQADALLPSLDTILAPVRDAFKQSGVSLDEAAAGYEAEKHAARAARRGIKFRE